MALNFNWKFWKKKETPAAAPAPAPPETAGKAAEEPSLSDTFKRFKGRMPQLLAAAKNPSVQKKVREIEERMKTDGVDTKDEKAVQTWIEAHKEELNPKPAAKIETFRRQTPKLGRNDPCHCGSGKKFKKCHSEEIA